MASTKPSAAMMTLLREIAYANSQGKPGTGNARTAQALAARGLITPQESGEWWTSQDGRALLPDMVRIEDGNLLTDDDAERMIRHARQTREPFTDDQPSVPVIRRAIQPIAMPTTLDMARAAGERATYPARMSTRARMDVYTAQNRGAALTSRQLARVAKKLLKRGPVVRATVAAYHLITAGPVA